MQLRKMLGGGCWKNPDSSGIGMLKTRIADHYPIVALSSTLSFAVETPDHFYDSVVHLPRDQFEEFRSSFSKPPKLTHQGLRGIELLVFYNSRYNILGVIPC